MEEQQRSDKQDEQGQDKLSLSFDLLQGQFAVMIMLERIETRLLKHNQMLQRVLEKVSPEHADPALYDLDFSHDELYKILKRIQADVDLVKALNQAQKDVDESSDTRDNSGQ